MKDNSLQILRNIELAKKNHREGNIHKANEIYKKLIKQKIFTHDLLFSYGLFNKERSVFIASSAQVRKKINSHSSGYWKNYEELLKPISVFSPSCN